MNIPVPDRCPNPSCIAHTEPPRRDFWIGAGYYRAQCRPEPTPRYRCRYCRRSFSPQTFRADYRDRRPDLNQQVLERRAKGHSLRRIARDLGIRRNNLAAKLRKLEQARAAGQSISSCTCGGGTPGPTSTSSSNF